MLCKMMEEQHIELIPFIKGAGHMDRTCSKMVQAHVKRMSS